MHVCRCKNENDVRRRLLESFQQSVERALRKHMHLVDNINLVFARNGRIFHLFAKVADFVDRAVACRVYLENIHIAGILQLQTRLATSARTAVYGTFAINRPRKNTGDGSLSRAPRSSKQIRVTDIARINLVDERPDDMRLSDNLVERIGTIFSVQRNMRHFLHLILFNSI